MGYVSPNPPVPGPSTINGCLYIFIGGKWRPRCPVCKKDALDNDVLSDCCKKAVCAHALNRVKGKM